MTKFAGYNEDEILPVFNLMISYLEAPVAHEALFKKYASKKFLKGRSYRATYLDINVELTICSVDLSEEMG